MPQMTDAITQVLETHRPAEPGEKGGLTFRWRPSRRAVLAHLAAAAVEPPALHQPLLERDALNAMELALRVERWLQIAIEDPENALQRVLDAKAAFDADRRGAGEES